MLAPIGGGGVSKATAADLKVGAEVLTQFQKRINGVLDTFENSQGSSKNIDAVRLMQASVTSDGRFHEAVGMHGQYESIHQRIVELSKLLSKQIEAMRIAVRGAEIGFDNLEEEERRKFWAIQTDVGRKQIEAEERNNPNQPDQRSNDKHTGMGLT